MRRPPAVGRLMARLGIDVGRFRASNTDSRRRHIMGRHGIDLVIDIGANKGQYATALRDFGYAGRIVSVEPHAATYRELTEKALADPAWTTLNLGVSDHSGEAVLNVPQVSAGSSFHEMTGATTTWIPDFEYTDKEVVALATLDEVVERSAAGTGGLFVKIDAQGHETEVLAGGGAALGKTDLIEIELSVQAMYEGQELWLEIAQRLSDAGFDLVGIEPEFVDPTTAYMVQVNGLFGRRDALKN